jgi:hypothetical protein
MKALLEDDAVSRLGIVVCVFLMGSPFGIPKETMEVLGKHKTIVDSTPYRFACIHFCYDSPLIRPIISIAAMTAYSYNRVRYQPCYGSPMECMYELQRYGIPRRLIPLDEDGNLVLDNFHQYIDSLQKKEPVPSSDQDNKMIMYPSPRDVLVGRGVPYQDWMGNVELTKAVDSYLTEYQSATRRGRKSEICQEIVDNIRKQGGRFIRRTNDGEGDEWEEVSMQEAIEKLGHLARKRTRQVAAGQERANAFSNFWDYVNNSSTPPPDDSMSSKNHQKRQRVVSSSPGGESRDDPADLLDINADNFEW